MKMKKIMLIFIVSIIVIFLVIIGGFSAYHKLNKATKTIDVNKVIQKELQDENNKRIEIINKYDFIKADKLVRDDSRVMKLNNENRNDNYIYYVEYEEKGELKHQEFNIESVNEYIIPEDKKEYIVVKILKSKDNDVVIDKSIKVYKHLK